ARRSAPIVWRCEAAEPPAQPGPRVAADQNRGIRRAGVAKLGSATDRETPADADLLSPAAPPADPQGLARRDPGTGARARAARHRPASSSVGPAGQPLSVA